MINRTAAKQKTTSATSELNTQLDQYFTFIIDNQEYGVDILRIQEVKGWTGVRMMPNLPAYIKGVIDIRGTIVPIIDLRERFGLNSIEYSPLTVVVVLKVNGKKGEQVMGLVVDAVSDVYDIKAENLKPAPDFGGAIEVEFVRSLATVQDKMVILLDVDALLGGDLPQQIKSTNIELETDGEILSESDIKRLEKSFDGLVPVAHEFTARFYQNLFEHAPAVKSLFSNVQMEAQQQKLVSALQLVISHLRQPEKLLPVLESLGMKHQQYGALPAHFETVQKVFMQTLKVFSGKSWNAQLEQSWQLALKNVSQMMLTGYLPDVSELNLEVLEKSFNLIDANADAIGGRFYQVLFEKYPDVKPMFANTSIAEQKQKLITSIKQLVMNLKKPKILEQMSQHLGKKHQSYGAIAEHFDAVVEVFLMVLKEFSGNAWTASVEKGWKQALLVIKNEMLKHYQQGPFSDAELRLLETSFEQLAPNADDLVELFYKRLFESYPQVKPMFKNADPNDQRKKLVAALQLVISNLRNPEKLVVALQKLGKNHQQYGAEPAHYEAVASIMLDSMKTVAGELWSEELFSAWHKALNTVAEIMLGGYQS